MYIIGTLCSIYAVIYLFIHDDRKCQLWAGFTAIIVIYLARKICIAIVKRKNIEINEIAKRKERLEIQVLGDKRLSSNYDPDDHV